MAVRKKKALKSNIALVEADKITIHGFDLTQEILGRVNLGDMAYLTITKRRPTRQESAVFNAIAVTLVEHGISTCAMVARMTYSGAPEAMQAAIAAGLCGVGSEMVGAMEDVARTLQEALPDPKARVNLDALARKIVASYGKEESIPGIGHHLHLPVDPRSATLIAIARKNGYAGPYVKLMQSIAKHAQQRSRKPLPLNATGTIGAIASELGLPWRVVRGIGVIARAIGLVGHVLEESEYPLTHEIRKRVRDEVNAHLIAKMRTGTQRI